jgi:hypothetical protein
MADGDWFAPKVFGIGSGPPITWQGWALTGIFFASTVVAGVLLMPRHHVIFIAVLVILVLGFSAIAAQHTQGGWHWRWGNDD